MSGTDHAEGGTPGSPRDTAQDGQPSWQAVPKVPTAPRVLVVDDNAINIDLVTFVLESDGFVVESAADADMAIARLARFQPDVILMDIQMPGTDGLELTRRLKSDSATRATPIVAFTAYAMKGDEAKMRAAGCDGYISKPIDVARFAEMVRMHVGAARRVSS